MPRRVLPAGEIGQLEAADRLEIVTEINGVEQDRWSTADLVRSVPELIAAISDFITLQPGDAVLIGTRTSGWRSNRGMR